MGIGREPAEGAGPPKQKPRLVERGLVGSLGPASGGWSYRQQARSPNAEPSGWLMVTDKTRTF